MALSPLRGAPPPVFWPVLDELQRDAVAHFGATGLQLKPLAYEDRQYSHLLLAEVTFAEARPAAQVFIKVLKVRPDGDVEAMRQRVALEYAATRAVHDRMKGWPGLDAIRPVACYAQQLSIVTERAEGSTLLESLNRRARWFPAPDTRRQLTSQLAGVGRWLNAFQSGETEERHVSLPALEDYVDVRLRRLVDHNVITTARRQTILTHLRSLSANVRATDLREVAVHGDLALANVLVSGDRIAVLDFPMAARGSYLHDISRLYTQIDILQAKPTFRPSVMGPLKAALLRGFDPALVPEHPLFRLFGVLHRINHFGTLSLRRERFPSSLMSSRVRRLHESWIDAELLHPAAALPT
jgi:hypothetical protein